VVKKGDIMENHLSGVTFTFLQSDAETKGELLQVHVSVTP